MRVLYVIDSLAPGGAETSLAAMAPHLRDHGVELHVLPLLDRPGVQDRLVAGGATVLPALGATRRRAVRGIRRAIRELRPDLVHTTLFEADVAGRVAARLEHVPVVTTLAAELPSIQGSLLRRTRLRAARALDRATSRWTRRFHAVSVAAAASAIAGLGLDPASVDVAHRGRDPAALGEPSPARRGQVRRDLGLPDDVPVVLAAGRQEDDKGFDLLLRAWPAVRAQVPGATLLVAGRRGAASPVLEQLAGELHGVVLLGQRGDVPDLLVAADVLVAPSRREGLPGTVVEAMLLGTPVVVSDIAPMLEVLGPDRPGTVVELSPDAIARGLVAALTDRATAANATEAARGRALRRFTIEPAVEGLVAIYRRALVV